MKANLAFFGTPEFAVPILLGLDAFCKQSGHHLSMVICQPDRPQSRGQKLAAPPVKNTAERLGVPVFQPLSLKEGTEPGDVFFDAFSQHHIDLAVVVAYGRIIPTKLLNLPKYGFVNVHASLLPRWRGAAPIQRAIQAGDTKTGVCIMDMEPELDTGAVYLVSPIPIKPQDDAISLSARLSELGRDALLSALPGILAGTLKKMPQLQEGISYAKKLSKEDGQIDWNLSAQEIASLCRAMQPWPGVFTTHGQNVIKLFGATAAPQSQSHTATPGTILSVGDKLVVQTGEGSLEFSEAQLPNKARMKIRDLINGYPIAPGEKL